MYLKSNDFDRFTNSRVAMRFFTLTSSMISWILRTHVLVGAISSKEFLICPTNLLKFESDMIEKQSITHLCSYSHKSYAFVVFFTDSEFTLNRKGRMETFGHFLLCFVYRLRHIICWYFIEACSFSVFNFYRYSIKCFLYNVSSSYI